MECAEPSWLGSVQVVGFSGVERKKGGFGWRVGVRRGRRGGGGEAGTMAWRVLIAGGRGWLAGALPGGRGR